MAQTLPKLRTSYGTPVGIELFFYLPDLTGMESTYLDADLASATGSCTANGVNFSVGQYVIIGNPGQEKSEIIRIHASTAPTETTITFVSNTVFAHNRGDKITFIPYNQIIAERSTDAGVNFTPLSAINIRPDSFETYLQRPSDASTNVYRFRFYNSSDSTYSAYSSQATASGFADNSFYAIKQRALTSLGEEIGGIGGTLTDKFLAESLQEARREVDQHPNVLRWSFRTSFNSDIGTIIPGTWKVAVPTDLRDQNTYKNILSLRIGKDNTPLEYQDINRFNENYYSIAHTTLNGALLTADTSIVLTSSGDFEESGAIDIAAQAVNETIDSVSYTANNESTNTLSGVTGIRTAGHATATDVWQGASFGLPTKYTVNDGYIYFDCPFSDDEDGENIYMDYYKTMSSLVNDSDTLDEPEYDLYVLYLRFKIKYLKANGKINKESDSDYLEFREKLEIMVKKEMTGQVAYFVPITSEDY